MKIHAVVDALGNPLRLHLTAGQKCELDGADVLLPGLKASTIIADKGFDAEGDSPQSAHDTGDNCELLYGNPVTTN